MKRKEWAFFGIVDKVQKKKNKAKKEFFKNKLIL